MWGLLAALSLIFNVGQGIAANDAAQKEAQAQKDQAAAQLEEGKVVAKQKGIEGEQFKSQQALAYLASGVSLEGSPLAILQETQYKTQLATDSILTRAQNAYDLGMTKADNLQKSGTAALFGGAAKGIAGFF